MDPDFERRLAAEIEGALPWARALRRDLHAHPELAGEESYASGVVRRELERAGVPFRAQIAGTGVVGWIVPGGAPGPDGIALRADMDALPIEEATGLEHASRNPGCMHACGHDGHTAMLLGAARVLARLRSELRRSVKFVFQPAEEVGWGARAMIEAGTLDERVGGFAAARAFALHGWPDIPLGTLATRPGPMMASIQDFRIEVRGRGGHASEPERTVDPIVAGAHIVTALQTLVSRSLSPLEAGVVSVGSFRAGEAANVIPETATLRGTIRALDDRAAAELAGRLEAVARGAASAFGAAVRVEIEELAPVTANDPAAVEFLREAVRGSPRLANLRILEKPVMGSEDFAFFARALPSCFAFLGLGPSGEGRRALHTPRFDFADEALGAGIEAFVRLALHGG